MIVFIGRNCDEYSENISISICRFRKAMYKGNGCISTIRLHLWRPLPTVQSPISRLIAFSD